MPNGAETVARTVRLWMQKAGEREVLLQVDLRNAFGSVLREKMFAEVKTRCPVLYPYAAACYRDSNLLLGDGYQLNFTRGVQQGDDCGPALFAIAIHTVVLLLRELGLDLNVWYLDDGILCGTIESVKNALELLKRHLLDWT